MQKSGIYCIKAEKGMGMKMDQKERWNQFASTGRVEDYLAYCRSSRVENSVGDSSRMETAVNRSRYENEGKHERDRYGDGDDINGISYERVR